MEMRSSLFKFNSGWLNPHLQNVCCRLSFMRVVVGLIHSLPKEACSERDVSLFQEVHGMRNYIFYQLRSLYFAINTSRYGKLLLIGEAHLFWFLFDVLFDCGDI